MKCYKYWDFETKIQTFLGQVVHTQTKAESWLVSESQINRSQMDSPSKLRRHLTFFICIFYDIILFSVKYWGANARMELLWYC